MFLILLSVGSLAFGQLSFSENMVDFGRITTHNGGKTQVYLKNLSKKNLYISAIDHYNSSFIVTVTNNEIPTGDSLLFSISVNSEYNVDIKDILVVKIAPQQNVILPMQASFYYFDDDVSTFFFKPKAEAKSSSFITH